MSLVVTKSGILDTFQDLGRFGHRRFGINTNGAMDRTALRAANLVLGNHENEAALEIHFPGPELEFRRRISFVVAGADFGCVLDGETVAGSRLQMAKRGSVLRFTRPFDGRRCYLSVKNGFRLTEWLSSKSTNLLASAGGFRGRKLRKGDEIEFMSGETVEREAWAGFRPGPHENLRLRFVPGPDFKEITAMSELVFRKSTFRISGNSDRMGYRLVGNPIYLLDCAERLSAPVTFGTIQVLPDGQLIMLMADHQTSGGYPNIGTVVGSDLPVAAQLGPGDSVGFQPVSTSEAEKLLMEHEKGFKLLKVGLLLSAAKFK